jgi:D-alanyl-lipoteichoic acid acyltransferase DltB (MBOAT superfamily)
MSLVSPGFFFFLAVLLGLNFITPKKYRWAVLLTGSYAFYFIMGGWVSLLGVNLAAFIIWRAGILLAGMRDKHEGKGRLRLPLTVALIILIGGLAAVKYANIIAVVGISFYVFQAVGYLIDVYAGKIQAEKDFFRLALFLSFFPQLVQGPIARHSQVAGDLYAGRSFDFDRARHGTQRIIWGYFIKLVVADRCAVAVNAVFGSPAAYGGVVTLFALFLYAVQVYGDFAGGISIMVGVGEIIGVKLPENFRQPFFAVSVSDFWRRWHITLGAWLKDYLFYPVALSKPIGKLGVWTRKLFGVRVGKLLPATVATFAVYFVMGIWHGATWQGFAFGLLNGLIISASQFAEPLFKRRIKQSVENKIKRIDFWRVFAVGRTFLIMLFLRVFVRAASMSDAVLMLEHVALNFNPMEVGMLLSLGLSLADYAVMFFGMAVMLAAEVFAEKGGDIFMASDRAPALLQGVSLLFILGFITVFGLYSGNAASAAFIYGQY